MLSDPPAPQGLRWCLFLDTLSVAGGTVNSASKWRLELAREIAAVYVLRHGVQMIVAGGSAARGVADDYSDIDILVYWDHVDQSWLESPPLPSSTTRRFTFHTAAADQVYLEQYFVGDVKVDIAHIALA